MSTPHRYWRVYIWSNAGAAYTDLAEVTMATSIGGPNVCSGGTPFASSEGTYDGVLFAAANAFDGETTGTGDDSWATIIGQGTPSFIGYDFGSSPQDIQEFTLYIRTTPTDDNGWPVDISLQYSDDGTDYTSTMNLVATLSAGVSQTFNTTLFPQDTGGIFVTQAGVDIYSSPSNPPINVTQAGVDAYYSILFPAPIAITQMGVDIYSTSDDPPIAITQTGVDVWFFLDPAPRHEYRIMVWH